MKPVLISIFFILICAAIYLYRVFPWLRIVLRKPDVIFIIGCTQKIKDKLKKVLSAYEVHIIENIDDFYPYHKRLCLFIIELDKEKEYPLDIYDIFKRETKEKQRAPVLFIGEKINDIQLQQWKNRGHDFVAMEDFENNEDLFIHKVERLIGKRRPALLPKKGQTFFGKYRISKELERNSVYCKFAGTATEKNIPIELFFLPAEYWAIEIKQRLRKIIDVTEADNFKLYSILESQNDSHLRCFVLQKYDGITLEDFVKKKGNLNVLETKVILTQITKGVHTFHKVGLYHGNIRPDNVFIPFGRGTETPDLDSIQLYGIECWPKYKKLAGAKLINTSRIAKNTLELEEYFSPEHLQNKPSRQYDLFYLGALIIFMLKGRIPYLQTAKYKPKNTDSFPILDVERIEEANSEDELEKIAKYLMSEKEE